jgi:hypothetical protein
MRFWILLWIIGIRLAWLCHKNEDFKAYIKDKVLILQFRTFGGQVARYFSFTGLRVHARHGICEQPDITLSFENARYAYSTIRAASQNPGLFLEGIQQGMIKASGDMGMLLWFMGIIKFIPPQKKSEKC